MPIWYLFLRCCSVTAVKKTHIQSLLNQSNLQAKEAVDLSDPFRITTGQIVVHCDDMNAFAGQGIQKCWQRSDQGFPFSGLHLGNLPFMKDHATDQLDVEWT